MEDQMIHGSFLLTVLVMAAKMLRDYLKSRASDADMRKTTENIRQRSANNVNSKSNPSALLDLLKSMDTDVREIRHEQGNMRADIGELRGKISALEGKA